MESRKYSNHNFFTSLTRAIGNRLFRLVQNPITLLKLLIPALILLPVLTAGTIHSKAAGNITIAGAGATVNRSLGMSAATMMQGQPCNPPSGLVAWYKADGNANDSAGGNNGAFINGPSYATGKSGQGFQTGAAYVRVPDAAALRPSTLTVAFWVKSTNSVGYTLSKSLDGSSGSYAFNASGFYITTNHGFVFSPALPVATVFDGNFHHLTGTYDGNAVRLFVDGIEVGNATPENGSIQYANGFDNGDLFFGRFYSGGFIFSGVMDDVQIYNRALSVAEIQTVYNTGSTGFCTTTYTISGRITTDGTNGLSNVTVNLSGSSLASTTTNANGDYSFQNLTSGSDYTITPVKPGFTFVPTTRAFTNLSSDQTADFTAQGQPCNLPSGLVAWYKADGNADDSAEGNNGISVNGSSYTTGINGQGFQTGTSYVRVSNAAALRPSTLTVAFWVKSSNPGDFPYLLSKSLTGGGGSYAFYAPGNLAFYITTSSGYIFSPIISAATVFNGNFRLITGTYDGTAVRLYVDGVEVGNGTPTTNSIRYDNGYENGDLFIGNFDSISGLTYTGVLDDVQIYNRALSAAEIQNLYSAGGSLCGASTNTIRGVVSSETGLASNITLTLTGDATATTTTNSNGEYIFTNVPAGESFTVTPSYPGYNFTPASRTFALRNLGDTYTANFTVQCPTISLSPASLLPNGTVGVPYTNNLSASGGGATYTFNVTSGAVPTGLQLNSNGTWIGTPMTAGTFNFTVTATNEIGCTGSQAYQLNIGSNCTVPAFTILTVDGVGTGNVTKNTGDAVTFTVRLIQGTALHYQWYKDGNLIATAPDSDSFSIPSLQTSDAGIYDVIVTTQCGRSEASISLNVNPPPSGNPKKVVILTTDYNFNANAVQSRLIASGQFSVVDLYYVGNTYSPQVTPTLAFLSQYNAVITWTNAGYNDATGFGNVLADYVDAGGGVVLATFSLADPAHGPGLAPAGRIITGNYLPVTLANWENFQDDRMIKDDASHPILNGVSSYTPSGNQMRNQVSLTPGATQVAHWATGYPYIATKQISAGKVVVVNTLPGMAISTSQAETFGLLLTNSLCWAAGTVTFTPTANDQTITTAEDTPINVTLTGSDPGGAALTYTVASNPAHGILTGTAPNLTYTPNQDFNGLDSFTFKVNNGSRDSNVATISLTVTAVNDPPTLSGVPTSATIIELVSYSFSAAANDVDVPAQTLTFSLVGAPAGASINPSTGQFSWTPTEAQGPGSYPFAVRVSDGTAYTDAPITLAVNEVNSSPTLTNVPTSASFVWGDPLSFQAMATDADLPANTLIFSLINAPVGASINPSTGQFSWTPTSAQLGSFTFTVRVTDDGTPLLYAEQTITLTVRKRPTRLVYTGAASGQYSDAVTLAATLTDVFSGAPVAGKSISFQLGNQSVNPVPTTNGSGVASGSVTLMQMAGAYTVASQFAGDALYLGSNDNDPFTVSKEATATTYTGDTSALTAGPNITTASVRLGANLVQSADGAAGDITLARVTFELFKGNNLSNTPDQVISGIGVDASGNALTTVNLGVDTWTIKVKVDSGNGYWVANPIGIGILNIALGSTDKRVTGSGVVPYSGSATGTASFGFTVDYQKNSIPKGNSVFAFRSVDPTTPGDPKLYDWVVKSNTWQGGGLSFYTDPSKASFNGKCNVQKIDPATGLVVSSVGNYGFTVDLKDGDLLNPRQGDAYGITILDNTNTIWRQVGTPGAPVTLSSGTVSVQSK